MMSLAIRLKIVDFFSEDNKEVLKALKQRSNIHAFIYPFAYPSIHPFSHGTLS
jgi:hypothetical protein